ncbi:hypothetical protein [Caenibius sp. WL]|uniref:hypothetical protein n=1 Tax=Caenibius sp. WL TaxID=2872646 RepID=UPI001C9A0A82|nr:hypothetical protein [Caenibius sp. WL]QZP08826.1 hypothetical protein K5X80_03300 [Caenibius sp. WL]
MSSDELARIIAGSIARHQTRGLVDGATGMEDVVIHGRVDLRAVAEDVFTAALRQARPARRSWAPWFICAADAKRQARRQDRIRERLLEQAENGPTPADVAIARMRMRGRD